MQEYQVLALRQVDTGLERRNRYQTIVKINA